jgi:GNAT superfamily N-acetyltransferase
MMSWTPETDAVAAGQAFRAAAARALGDRVARSAADFDPARALTAHVAAFAAWGLAIGGVWRTVDAHATPEVLLSGRLQIPPAPRSRDEGKIRILIGRTEWVADELANTKLMADPRDLWLAPELQRRGYGGTLIAELLNLWFRLGVQEARATAVTDASKSAFASWGWVAQQPDPHDPQVQYRRTVQP